MLSDSDDSSASESSFTNNKSNAKKQKDRKIKNGQDIIHS